MMNWWGNTPCSVAEGSLIHLTHQREGKRALSHSESPHQERSTVMEGFSAWLANRHSIHSLESEVREIQVRNGEFYLSGAPSSSI